MNLLHIDFETKAFVDLTKTNAWIYSECPQADIICMAYKFNDDIVKIWEPGQSIPEELSEADFIIAHNALFEHAIISNIGIKKYNFPSGVGYYSKYICTAGMARSAGLPGSLEKCGQALNIKHQKLDQGKKLIQKYCRPKKNRTTGKYSFIPLEGQDKKDMFDYCLRDVEAEHEIFEVLKNLPNNKLERSIFVLDFKQNTRGLKVDIDKVDRILDFIGTKNNEIEKEVERKNPGLNVRSTQQFKKAINKLGYDLPDTQEKTLLDLYNNASPGVQELIDARLFLSKASVKKYQALKTLTSPDSRTRHFLLYYGAGTGRYAGRGFQPHNLPKSQMKEVMKIDDLKSLNNVNIIEALKKLLPTMIIPNDEYKFISGDFAAIEARVLAYLSGEEKMLTAYKNDQDLYIDMAKTIYHTDKIDKAKRQLGKAAILGAGYGMAHEKFLMTCKSWGMEINENLAKESIYSYRNNYTNVPKFWYDLESAFKKALLSSDKQTVGLITIEKIKNYIAVTLPNGRVLYYHKCRIKGNNLEYWNHSRGFYVKLWGGIITENIVQAVSRDILTDRMLILDSKGLNPVLHVHDEIICEVKEKEVDESFIVFDKVMNTPPEWLTGFPLKTECEITNHYTK